MGKCKHKFKVLRESSSAGFFKSGWDMLVQCEKCLKLFTISDNDKIKEVIA